MTLVSIVIPTYNRLARLRRVLTALEHQQYPLDQIEVVVVSDGSSDGTHAYLSTIQTPLRLTFIAQANAGPAAARNSGFRRAAGEHILFIDDDIIASPQLVAQHMELHAAQTDLVVLGPMLSPRDFALSPWVEWEQAMLAKQYAAMQAGDWAPTARQFYTGNTSLARRHLLASGGFDERFRRAEDVELAYRLQKQGVSFVFNQAAIGYHYVERSFRSWLEIPYAYGRNDVVFSRENQAWIESVMRTEYHQRNALTRALIALCLDRGRVSAALQALIARSANLSYRAGGRRLTQAAYSALFNVRYYQGVADELGGRGHFFNDMGSRAEAHAERSDHV